MAGTTELLVGSTAVLVLLGYCWCRRVMSYWERRNIKGPKPLPLIGNVIDMVATDRQKMEIDWAKKYGKVYGVFVGMRPQLVVADPEVMIQLSVRDFNYMPNHDNYINNKILKHLGNYLFNLVDDSWRRVRALMSPTFTSSKIRKMFKLLNECSDDLVLDTQERLAKSNNNTLHVKDLFNYYTMNGISSCCFALKLGRSGPSDTKSIAARDFFIKCGMECVKPNYMSLVLYFILPEAVRNYFGVYPLSETKIAPLTNKVREVIRHRRQTSMKHDDLLQLMLDAEVTNELELDEMDAKENHYANLTSESLKQDQLKLTSTIDKSKGYLTDIELVANSTVMITAGLETTSTLLTVTSYCLAHHQDIQEKLYQELTGLFKDDQMDYEALAANQYMDCVISEALRILTPVAFIERQLTQDYKLESHNLKLPRDMKVTLSLHAIMNDPEYWPEPEKYKPERFLPENKDKIVAGSYCPFGLGPRHCIGMRFALSEAKLGMAKILMKYRLLPASDTTFPPPAMAPVSLTIVKKPHIEFKIRNS